ncbi:MAG: RNA polymerase sigma factor [Pirellulales bacterium]
MSDGDLLLIDRIRTGDEAAWNELIARYEGRLLAYVESRLRRRAESEDVVQETFVGFLSSVVNYDDSRPLETYLFSIAAHKLTDFLRREGRRPTLPLAAGGDSQSQWDPPDRQRRASAIAQSGERRKIESDVIARLLAEEVARWRERGDWTKLKCLELLIVRGMANKDAATALDISEQQVANFKFDFLARLRTLVRRQDLSEDMFPELRDHP